MIVPTMVSLREAARLTGLSYDFLRRGCNEGRFPSIRVGDGKTSHIKINLTWLSHYLEEATYEA